MVFDLGGAQLRNAKPQPLAVPPASPFLGQEYLDTSATPAVKKMWDGTTWAAFGGGGGGGGPAGYAADIGDGATANIVVTHNLHTRDVIARVRRNTAPFEFIEPDIEATTADTVTFRFAAPPTAGQYRAVIAPVTGP